MRLYSKKKNSFFPVIIAVFLLLSAKEVSARNVADQEICAAVIHQYDQPNPSQSPNDWPKNLAFPGLIWPEWHTVDATKYLYVMQNVASWDRVNPEYEGHITPAQAKQIWDNYAGPREFADAKNGALQMQVTRLQFLATQLVGYSSDNSMSFHANILRYRFVATEQWSYIILDTDINDTVINVPLLLTTAPMKDELALIDSKLVIFDTTPYRDVAYVLIFPKAAVENEYDAGSSYSFCELK